jgi:hypothetical protein
MNLNIDSQLSNYRRTQHSIYMLKNICNLSIDIDICITVVNVIQRFIRKFVLMKPENLSNDEINLIPGKYRYRFYVYDQNNKTDTIGEVYNIERLLIINDPLIFDKRSHFVTLKINKNININKFIILGDFKKHVVMIDLRSYKNGIDSEPQIFSNDVIYNIDSSEKTNIISECNKVF